jgi:hypothetical protein
VCGYKKAVRILHVATGRRLVNHQKITLSVQRLTPLALPHVTSICEVIEPKSKRGLFRFGAFLSPKLTRISLAPCPREENGALGTGDHRFRLKLEAIFQVLSGQLSLIVGRGRWTIVRGIKLTRAFENCLW